MEILSKNLELYYWLLMHLTWQLIQCLSRGFCNEKCNIPSKLQRRYTFQENNKLGQDTYPLMRNYKIIPPSCQLKAKGKLWRNNMSRSLTAFIQEKYNTLVIFKSPRVCDTANVIFFLSLSLTQLEVIQWEKYGFVPFSARRRQLSLSVIGTGS